MSYPTLCIACGHARSLHDGPEGVCVGNCTSLEPLVQCGCPHFRPEQATSRIATLEAENAQLKAEFRSALVRFGRHTMAPQCAETRGLGLMCTCGLAAALQETTGGVLPA